MTTWAIAGGLAIWTLGNLAAWLALDRLGRRITRHRRGVVVLFPRGDDP